MRARGVHEPEALIGLDEIAEAMPDDIWSVLGGGEEVCGECQATARLDVRDFDLMTRAIKSRNAIATDPRVPVFMYRVTIRCLNGHERIWRPGEPERLPPSPVEPERICPNPACRASYTGEAERCPSCLARQRGRARNRTLTEIERTERNRTAFRPRLAAPESVVTTDLTEATA